MKATIKDYLSGRSSAEEQRKLLSWLREKENQSEFIQIKEEWKKEIIQKEIPTEFKPSWESIQTSIYDKMKSEVAKTKHTLQLFRYAAAILVFLILIPSLFWIFSKSNPKESLSYTTVAADYGQISKVVLPDSTVIWINSGSTIRYNNQFAQTNRHIDLVGEAFLKVHKNKNLPLIVNSSDLQVKVLGTEFCVSAYPEEKEIQVILEHGKVELTALSQPDLRQEMSPGELASYNKEDKKLKIAAVNTGLYTSWRNGMINVYNLPLSELAIKLEKRYNQKFIVDDEIKNLPYTFTIKNEDLHSILSLMEKITPLDAIQRDNVIELRFNRSKKPYKAN